MLYMHQSNITNIGRRFHFLLKSFDLFKVLNSITLRKTCHRYTFIHSLLPSHVCVMYSAPGLYVPYKDTGGNILSAMTVTSPKRQSEEKGDTKRLTLTREIVIHVGGENVSGEMSPHRITSHSHSVYVSVASNVVVHRCPCLILYKMLRLWWN